MRVNCSKDWLPRIPAINTLSLISGIILLCYHNTHFNYQLISNFLLHSSFIFFFSQKHLVFRGFYFPAFYFLLFLRTESSLDHGIKTVLFYLHRPKSNMHLNTQVTLDTGIVPHKPKRLFTMTDDCYNNNCTFEQYCWKITVKS